MLEIKFKIVQNTIYDTTSIENNTVKNFSDGKLPNKKYFRNYFAILQFIIWLFAYVNYKL